MSPGYLSEYQHLLQAEEDVFTVEVLELPTRQVNFLLPLRIVEALLAEAVRWNVWDLGNLLGRNV